MPRFPALPLLFAVTIWAAISLSPRDAAAQAEQGAKEIAVESMFIVGHQNQDGNSATQVAALGGVSFRLFIKERIAVGISAGGFYRRASADESDTGGLIRLLVGLSIPLADKFHIAPTIAFGGIFGSRRRRVSVDTIQSRGLTGATFGLGLPFILYTDSRFDVRAGPEILVSAGNVAEPSTGGGESEKFANVDGGFNVGVSWSF